MNDTDPVFTLPLVARLQQIEVSMSSLQEEKQKLQSLRAWYLRSEENPEDTLDPIEALNLRSAPGRAPFVPGQLRGGEMLSIQCTGSGVTGEMVDHRGLITRINMEAGDTLTMTATSTSTECFSDAPPGSLQVIAPKKSRTIDLSGSYPLTTTEETCPEPGTYGLKQVVDDEIEVFLKPLPDRLCISEVANVLGTNRNQIYRYIRQGKLDAIASKDSSPWMVSKEALRKMLETFGFSTFFRKPALKKKGKK